jgi:hypothetical protein
MGNGNKGNPEHPLAADISKQRAKQKAGIIAIIVLSSVFAVILFAGAAWFVLFKLRYSSHPPGHTPSSLTKASGMITLLNILVPNFLCLSKIYHICTVYAPYSSLNYLKEIQISNVQCFREFWSSIYPSLVKCLSCIFPIFTFQVWSTFEHLCEILRKIVVMKPFI